MKSIVLAAAVALLTFAPVRAQVLVAPTTLVLSPQNRFGVYIVTNQTELPQEVTIDFRFGYPASDAAGGMFMEYEDTAAARRFSMAGWVRAFPRQFVLPPGAQQVVRLTARPPADAMTGTYWSRIVTASTPQTPPPEEAAGGVVTRLVFRLEQVTTVLYRHGVVSTGVLLPAVRAVVDADGTVHVLADLRRTGNSPFLGTASLRVLDAAGRPVTEVSESLALYFDQLKRFSLEPGTLRSGSYTAEVTAVAERNDIARRDLLPAPPASGRATFVVP